jgi:hypothetical protein
MVVHTGKAQLLERQMPELFDRLVNVEPAAFDLLE